MATFVLVHGAWHGGWCWRRVSDLLERKGHKVFTPTMTGLGERSHLLTKEVNLDTHITDIVNVFRFEDIRGACLVVHSYGGWPGSGALEQIGDRVASIVWLDAFKPENGQKGIDFASEFSRKAMEEAVAKGLPGRKGPPSKAFGVNEKDQAWVDSLTGPQPIATMTEKLKLTGAVGRIDKKAYVRAGAYPNPGFDKALQRVKADRAWRTYDVPCGHDVMVDMPERLAEILGEVA
ncbi:MAG: alpha/beta fold hydrolase [Panacagrimonas sp.]